MDKRQNFLDELTQIITPDATIKSEFIRRFNDGKLTRDENPQEHFCVYFAPYDPKNALVFIGHHKKSGLWLFNGGHIDIGELPSQAMYREIKEEWGYNTKLSGNHAPAFLTITEIENPTKQTCRRHYDIWYFLPFDQKTFKPSEDLLEKEFYRWGWKSLNEARSLVTNTQTLQALVEIEKLFEDK